MTHFNETAEDIVSLFLEGQVFKVNKCNFTVTMYLLKITLYIVHFSCCFWHAVTIFNTRCLLGSLTAVSSACTHDKTIGQVNVKVGRHKHNCQN